MTSSLAKSRWLLAAWLMTAAAVCLAGCGRGEISPHQERRRADYDARIRERWGKPLDELPVVTLVLISPHNENIQTEYEWAFSLHHALEHGQRVGIEWRDVGGGGSTIQKYLQNVYGQADTAEIDVLWGGGDLVFSALLKPTGAHEQGILEPLDLPEDVLANVPQEIRGQRLYGYARGEQAGQAGVRPRWIGSALSGFGFLCNAGMLDKCGIARPRAWSDLGDARFTDLIELADPAQSGSVTATYLMIVKSEFADLPADADDAAADAAWRRGWAKLLMLLSNAKRITDSAGSAANAPALGDALVATSIDFYGLMRVAEAPGELVYVSPAGQTSFGPDPIGILKNPPHPQTARRFVEFVMSPRGQALWGLRVGEPDGPVRTALGRQPIRRDVYDEYADGLIDSIVNPFEAEAAMPMHPRMNAVNFGILRRLVVAAAVDNLSALRDARRRLNELQRDSARPDEYARRLDAFVRLPGNVDTLAEMNDRSLRPKEPKARRRVDLAWRDAFHDRFSRIAE